MIEVLFGESEAGSMKAAKNKFEERTSDEVICLGFMLDIGNIKESPDSSYRKKLIYSMYSQNQWNEGENDEDTDEPKKAGDFYAEARAYSDQRWGLVVRKTNRSLYTAVCFLFI